MDKKKLLVPRPTVKDSLLNFDWMESYGLLFQLSICSYYVGKYQESLDLCDILLSMENLPEGDRKQTEKNRTFPRKIESEIASASK